MTVDPHTHLLDNLEFSWQSGNLRYRYGYCYTLAIVFIVSRHSQILVTITLESPDARCRYGYHYMLNSDRNRNCDGLVS